MMFSFTPNKIALFSYTCFLLIKTAFHKVMSHYSTKLFSSISLIVFILYLLAESLISFGINISHGLLSKKLNFLSKIHI